MFRLEDIICSNKFTRKFQAIVNSLNHCPRAILVTRKAGDYYVFLKAQLYQDLLDRAIYGADSQQEIRSAYWPKEEIQTLR